ncbi:DUF2326 domain-containing protein [Polycladidibacter stylochi]|uniref:DUF2326 domain-containing protein n=1 Tax=Polycladidibacter stylochi TaxID=1807766 RepID=UPI0009E7E1F9
MRQCLSTFIKPVQFARALEIGAAFSKKTGVQYIVTLNSDELERAEREGGKQFTQYVLDTVLSDERDGGLFGFRFN